MARCFNEKGKSTKRKCFNERTRKALVIVDKAKRELDNIQNNDNSNLEIDSQTQVTQSLIIEKELKIPYVALKKGISSGSKMVTSKISFNNMKKQLEADGNINGYEKAFNKLSKKQQAEITNIIRHKKYKNPTKTIRVKKDKIAFKKNAGLEAYKKAEEVKKSIKRKESVKRVAKASGKTVTYAIKGTLVACKALFLYGSGTLFLIPLLLVIFLMMTFSSPLAVFTPSSSKHSSAISYITQLNNEFEQSLSEDAIYNSEEGDTSNNIVDVLIIYSVRNSTTYGDASSLMDMSNDNKKKLKEIFDEMNEAKTEYVTKEVVNDDGSISYQKVKQVVVYQKSYLDYYDNFAKHEKEIVDEFINPQTLAMLTGQSFEGSISTGEMNNINNNLKPGEIGSEAVKLALTRLGHPYSQEKRGQGNYVDCSSFVKWVYNKLGVPIVDIAATQAKWCVDNNYVISKDDLAPGDLVFWSHKKNGRYMNVTHVGFYAGDGKVIDASFSKKQVVYRNMFDTNKVVLYARPYRIE